MRVGDYVQHRKTKRRGEVLDILSDGELLLYAPGKHPLDQLWFAREDELTRLLRKEEIGDV